MSSHDVRPIVTCPKCGCHSGGDWSQCKGSCPMRSSPHHVPGSNRDFDRGGVARITDARKQELRFKIWELSRGVLTDTANTRASMPLLTDEEYEYAREFMLGIAEKTRPDAYADD